MRHHRLDIETPGGNGFNSDRIAVGVAENGLNGDFAVNFEEINRRITGNCPNDHDFPTAHHQVRSLLNGDRRAGSFKNNVSPHIAGELLTAGNGVLFRPVDHSRRAKLLGHGQTLFQDINNGDVGSTQTFTGLQGH